MKNISLKVAVGFALACEPGARWHGSEILAGYARVGVDEVVPGYESLELDIAGAEDERTLGEVGGGIILWLKEDIKFPGLVLNPPPPRGNSAPPSPPSQDGDDHHSASSSRSPPTRQPFPPPLQPSPPPPPRPPTTKSKGQNPRKRAAASLSTSQGRHKTTKVPEVSLKPLPQRTYDRTDEENEAIADADLNKWKAGLKARKEPQPKPVYSEKDQKWAMGMLTQPPQFELNKPDRKSVV